MGLEAIQPRQGADILAALLGQPQPQIGVIPIDWNRFDTRRAFLSDFRKAGTAREIDESLLPVLRGKSAEEQHTLLASQIQREVASILRYSSPSAVPPLRGFRELGLDSLTSMELRNRLQNSLECSLPAAVIFNHPTVDALARYIAESVLAGTGAIESPAALQQTGSVSAGMRERMLTVGGLNICLCEWGPEDGRLILCVHGTRDHGASWEGVAAGLAAEGYRVVAPDLRGHGRSDHGGASSPYHLRDFVGDLARIVQTLCKEPVILMGHSLGAIVSALYASACPERVEELILVEPPLWPFAPDGQSFAQQLTDHLGAAGEARRHDPMPDLATAAARLRELTPALSAEASLQLAGRLTQPQGSGAVWRWDARFDGQAQLNSLFAGLRGTEFLAMLAGIRARLTIVFGEGSGWISPAEKTRILDARPELQSTILPGGHNVHLDSPAALASVVLQATKHLKGMAVCQ